MFYSPDILKRKEGFSVIWLAATLGAKSSFKKLPKRDILSVDVPRACTFLSDSDEPLALRLSSNLMYGVTRVFSQQYQFLYTDVNVMHTRIRRETMLFNAMNALGGLLEETPDKISPRKPIELTLPDSDTYIPEFGLCLPPELMMEFNDLDGTPTPVPRDQVDFALNLSDPLQTPLSRGTNDFSLPGYDMSVGHDSSNDSGFGDYSDGGGFSNYYDEEYDILRYANDSEHLDFNLEPTPAQHRKRPSQDSGGGDISKRARHISADDDDIQRIAREDHDNARRFQYDDFNYDRGGFGEPNFDEYRSPAPVVNDALAVETIVQDDAPKVTKRRRIIVEDDSSTIKDGDFRLWPQKYIETQAAANARRKTHETTKLAKERAMNYLWGWNGRENSSLHPSLSQLFSRIALLKRWKPDFQPTNPGEKRKRDDGGELDYGMGGFGRDTGGFGDTMDYSEMEIARHAEEVGDGGMSIQLLTMPWNNIPSRNTSRQTSQDPQGHSQSRDSMHSGGGGFRSSVSRILDDTDFGGQSSPIQHRYKPGARGASGTFDSQVDLLEKESREFCE